MQDARRHRGESGGGVHAQDEVTLRGVNADWAKARQRAHVRTHSLQRAQTGFTADNGTLIQPSLPSTAPPLPSSHLLLCHPVFADQKQPMTKAGGGQKQKQKQNMT